MQMKMLFRLTLALSMIIGTAALVSGCAAAVPWIPGSVSTKIAPRAEEGLVSLQCQASSTGTCYFLVGEMFETTYEVKQGESKAIVARDHPLPVCASHSASYRLHCNKQTTVGPGAAVVYQSSSAA